MPEAIRMTLDMSAEGQKESAIKFSSLANKYGHAVITRIVSGDTEIMPPDYALPLVDFRDGIIYSGEDVDAALRDGSLEQHLKDTAIN